MLENRLKLHIWNRVLGIGVWFYLSLAIALPLIALIFFALYSEGGNFWQEKKEALPSNSNTVKPYQGIFDEISTPAAGSLWIPLPDISKNLLFLEYNDRPDCKREERAALIGLKGTDQERFVKEGDSLYFSCTDQDSISFSDSPTPFLAQFHLNHQGQLKVTFTTKYLGTSQQEIFKTVSHFTVERNQKNHQVEAKEKMIKEMTDTFLAAKCFLYDQLFDLYGGAEYAAFRHKYRLKVPKEGGDDYLFVAVGDLITFEEGKWVVSNGKTLGKPLVFVKSIQGKTCELTLWGESGISSQEISIPLSLGSPLSTNMHELFSKVHKRTESSVVCDLAGKHTVIRKGDWLIKTNGKWRNLRHLNELKDFLVYVLKGELFIFDGIETRGTASHFMGHYFNDERTQVLKIDIPINDKLTKDKNQAKKKKPALRTGTKEAEGVHRE